MVHLLLNFNPLRSTSKTHLKKKEGKSFPWKFVKSFWKIQQRVELPTCDKFRRNWKYWKLLGNSIFHFLISKFLHFPQNLLRTVINELKWHWKCKSAIDMISISLFIQKVTRRESFMCGWHRNLFSHWNGVKCR